ncbi:MAG: hypothetical protein LH618_02095 [Saprospiraceae bacterium]|nr:hypothetical protein [Saprospiraceae bacterium]
MSLSKFDESGELLWSEAYALDEGNGLRIFSSVDLALSGDGRPVLWGTTAAEEPVDHQAFVMQIDPNDGDIQVAQTIADPEWPFTASDILPVQANTFLLGLNTPDDQEIARYLKYDLDEGVIWSHLDDKTNFTGNLLKTVLSPDGYFYSVTYRGTLAP